MSSDPNAQTFIASDMFGPFRSRRLLVLCIFLVLALAPGPIGHLTRGLMVDAYVQVSAFVAATLLLFYGAERVFRFDIGSALKKSKGFQVPMAALLGTTPGCGGGLFFGQCQLWCGGRDSDRDHGRCRLSADRNPSGCGAGCFAPVFCRRHFGRMVC
jgi:hypothetical protein